MKLNFTPFPVMKTASLVLRAPQKADAKDILLKYRFPGNIRQLKNLVEQISVLDTEREINAEKLRKFLPKENSHLPMLFNRNGSDNQLTERDLLYKVLFEMRKDVNDLKKLVHQYMSGEQTRSEIIERNPKFFKQYPSEF